MRTAALEELLDGGELLALREHLDGCGYLLSAEEARRAVVLVFYGLMLDPVETGPGIVPAGLAVELFDLGDFVRRRWLAVFN